MSPPNQWGWRDVLANKANNLLEQIIWQNSNMGVKKSKQTAKPQPFIPDFMRQPGELSKEAEVHTTDDIRDILAQPRG